jgi:hypothetical protein
MKFSLGRGFLFLMILLILPEITLHAQTQTQNAAKTVEGEKQEFPLWVRDLRRFDIIAFGAFPFSFFLAGFAVDTYRASQHNWDSQYAPWPINMGGSVVKSTDEHIITLAAAAGISVVVALTDHFIQRGKRNKAAREAARLAPGDPIIIRAPWPLQEEDENAGSVPPDQAAPDREAPDPADSGPAAGSIPADSAGTPAPPAGEP